MRHSTCAVDQSITTARRVDGLGWANQTTVGIELVGHGKEFPAPQVEAAKLVWAALVKAYTVQRRFAMLAHSEIDPTRRSDPGPLWLGRYAESVLDAAYG